MKPTKERVVSLRFLESPRSFIPLSGINCHIRASNEHGLFAEVLWLSIRYIPGFRLISPARPDNNSSLLLLAKKWSNRQKSYIPCGVWGAQNCRKSIYGWRWRSEWVCESVRDSSIRLPNGIFWFNGMGSWLVVCIIVNTMYIFYRQHIDLYTLCRRRRRRWMDVFYASMPVPSDNNAVKQFRLARCENVSAHLFSFDRIASTLDDIKV